MRLRSISLRGATRFIGAEPVRIDFDSLGEGLIALVGTNGAGKTTLLEATPAALHKSFPSRPSWYENFTGRDSFLEATFDDDGHELKVRLAVDAERRQTESYIFRDGVSLTTGRSAEFDAEIERRFGSRELLLASVFASQGKEGNFLLLKKADRKSLFVELLGLGVLEVLHESAKDRSGAAEHELDVARVAVTGVEAEVADLLVRQMELGEAESAADRAAGALTTARTEEAAALAALERARSAGERLKALEDAEAAAAREVKAADRLIDEAIDAEDKATDRYEERLRFLENGKVEELEPRALTRHTGAMERLQARRVTLEAALQNIPDVARARAELDAFELDLVGLDEADQETAQAKLSHERAVLDLKAAESKLVAATKARTDEIARLKRSAGLLPQVPCTARPQWGMEVDAPDLEGCIEDFIDLAGTCPLLSDARSAQARILILEADPSEGEEAAEKARREAAEKVTAAADERTGLEATAHVRAQAREILKRHSTETRAAIARAEAAETARQQLAQLVTDISEEMTRHATELQDAREKVHAATQEAARVLEERDAALAEAEERRAAAAETLKAAKERYGEAAMLLEKEQAQTVSVGLAQPIADAAKNVREAMEKALREADSALARVRAQVDALNEKAAALPMLRERVGMFERELGDWTLLARALGKDGVQALEIDAAGPEVARLTNELLTACYGPRFSISFETLREKKSARGEYSEAFDVKVYDAGAERPVEALSGGEKVVVGEAIGLAIAIFNARKSGIRWETLWRDETAGALDPENAAAYVMMLRRARELGGFAQVIFVSHSPEVWESADVRLLVAGGRVSVEAERRAA